MAQPPSSSQEVHTRDDLIAGDFPIITDEVILFAGQNRTRGAVLGRITATGKYVHVDDSAVDGSEVARAVLIEDTDATAADKTNTPVYFSGEFNVNKLNFGGGDVAADHIDNMRALAMFQKTPVKDS